VLRNPVYFIFLILLGVAAYGVYYTNTAAPLLNVARTASNQAIAEGKVRLRKMLEDSETGRQAMGSMGMPSTRNQSYEMSDMNGAKTRAKADDPNDDDEL